MPDEYDAFGRKKDDTGLGDLGWGATEAARTQPPAVSTTPATQAAHTTPATPVIAGPTRRRRNPAVPLIQFAVFAAIVAAVALAVMSGGNATDSARQTLDGFTSRNDPGGTTTSGDDGDGTVPKQVRAKSFFTPQGLRAGLRILAKEQPGRITNFSFRKDRINVQVNRGGKSHNVQMSLGAEVPQELSVSTASTATVPTLSYEEINPGAVGRLMGAANARLNASPKQVDYFAIQKWTGSVQWGIYYKNGKIAQGDSRGRFTRRLS